MLSPLRIVLFVAVLACASARLLNAAPPASGAAGEAERIVFLLQYVGTDYALAVSDGRIVDDAEYAENRDFAHSIAERYAEIRGGVPATNSAGLDKAIADLRRLVDEKGDPGAVREAAETAIPTLIEAFGLRAFPRERPARERATRLFAENCAPCHGAGGDGDGPRAKDLDPPPAKLADPERLDGTPPYVFYNAITLGVANTAMASFADGLSDQDRWDLAFYVWSLRKPPPAAGASPIRLSLRDLATRSSKELAPEVARQAKAQGLTIDDSEAAAWIAALRADPPILSDSEERLARMRQDLAATVALVRQGKLDIAADRVTTAYLTEFEPLEREIDNRDKSIRTSFERGLVDLRAALRRNDSAAALAVARDLGVTVDRADDLLTAKPSIPRAWKWLTVLGVVTAAAVIAIVVSSRRIGNHENVG